MVFCDSFFNAPPLIFQPESIICCDGIICFPIMYCIFAEKTILLISDYSEKKADAVKKLENYVDLYEDKINNYLFEISQSMCDNAASSGGSFCFGAELFSGTDSFANRTNC